MLKSISSMDGVNEGFYHGMMLGLCAVLGNRYRVRSNRESGLGRFDIQLMPLVNGIPGFIFEFKHTNRCTCGFGLLGRKCTSAD
ncbi:MAG: PD-(D/E)XK nuclease domain-containing protein [Gemmiger formicilis]|uniref:PD-(D/E)XK nuclease domain-containing protein n=1 Tax=Gemmiger formicilis TaxID=745368 RepID=UPI003995CD8A